MLGILRHRSTDPPVTGATLQIGTGTSLIYYAPNNYNYRYSRTAFIWTAAEMGTAKTINSVQFYNRSYGSFAILPNQTLKIGHVTSASFAATSPLIGLQDLTITELTTVKGNFAYSTSQNNIWWPIIFDTNFVYNGTSNLILIWENNSGDWSSTAGGSDGSTQPNKGIYSGDMDTPLLPNTVADIHTRRPNIKFGY